MLKKLVTVLAWIAALAAIAGAAATIMTPEFLDGVIELWNY